MTPPSLKELLINTLSAEHKESKAEYFHRNGSIHAALIELVEASERSRQTRLDLLDGIEYVAEGDLDNALIDEANTLARLKERLGAR
jgi:hypothetical protein